MRKRRIFLFRVTPGAALLLLLAIMIAPLSALADGNRVYYTPDSNSFTPGSLVDITAEGHGNGINKVTVNASPDSGYYLNFTINNNNNGTDGTTFFETRKGPGNNDLSPNVTFLNGDANGNTTYLTFPNDSSDVPLYVQVYIPPCNESEGGTFRIQAHPGGSAHQGNGPGVVVSVNCNPNFFPGGGGQS